MHQGSPTDALGNPCSPCTAGVQNRMGGTFFALAFLGFTSLTTGAHLDLVAVPALQLCGSCGVWNKPSWCSPGCVALSSALQSTC